MIAEGRSRVALSACGKRRRSRRHRGRAFRKRARGGTCPPPGPPTTGFAICVSFSATRSFPVARSHVSYRSNVLEHVSTAGISRTLAIVHSPRHQSQRALQSKREDSTRRWIELAREHDLGPVREHLPRRYRLGDSRFGSLLVGTSSGLEFPEDSRVWTIRILSERGSSTRLRKALSKKHSPSSQSLESQSPRTLKSSTRLI